MEVLKSYYMRTKSASEILFQSEKLTRNNHTNGNLSQSVFSVYLGVHLTKREYTTKLVQKCNINGLTVGTPLWLSHQ